ncbi:MAG: ABC transporter substrate-binding protein [Actinomycetes bacterium]|jgi:peptide/nickel transport system substrate-binding protein|nr:ABC transporter substrate-binding protein [Actinomycetes bacterium]
MKKTRLMTVPIWVVVFILACCLVAVVGCQSAEPASTTTDDGAKAINSTLKVGLCFDAPTLDAIYSYDYSTAVVTQISEGLLYYDNQDALQNGLAESWEEVDPTTYVYNVRSNVTFSDGTPMTMDDVMYSLERYRDADLASYLSWMYDSVDSIEQTGDWQFTVKLKQADALWKHTFATTGGMIQSKAAIEAAGKDYGGPGSWPVGTGPYKVSAWSPGSEIVLEYNDNYWNKAADGEPDIKTVEFQIITEDATRIMAITSGQIDLNTVTPVDLLPDVEKSENVNYYMIPSGGMQTITFNCLKAPFDDANIRRAIACAIDIEPIQQSIVGEWGDPTNYLLVPEQLFTIDKQAWLDYQSNAKVFKYNLDEAKSYLAKSSKPDGFECELLVGGNATENSFALAVQQALKELNITVNIKKVSNDELNSTQFGTGITDGVRPYEMAIFEWNPDFPDPSADLTPMLMSNGTGEGGSNFAAFKDKTVDAKLNEQAASADDAERTKLMQEALDIVNDQVPYYVWTHHKVIITANKRITAGISDLTASYFWHTFIKNVKVSE